MAYTTIGLLILGAPFEATQPLLTLPTQSVSNLEAVVLLAIATSAAAWFIAPRPHVRGATLLGPWLTFCAAGVLAAVLASEHRGNAVHMALRLALAGGVYAATVVALAERGRVTQAMWWLLSTGVVVSVLAILEYLEIPVVLAVLKVFRPSVALVGAQVRAAGPLQYPTIASMVLEICFACGLGLLARALAVGTRRSKAGIIVALAIIGEGIVVTFTRSGLITAGLAILLVAASATVRLGWRGVLPFALVAGIGVAEVAVSRSNEVIGARLASEGQEGWYRARVEAPASLVLESGRVTTVPIRLTNDGRITWSPDTPQPFRVSYHWLEADSARVVEWEGTRTLLPGTVPPGDTLSLTASVTAPSRPGKYRLIWDVEQTDRLWFSTEPDAQLVETTASVEGSAVGARRSGGPIFMPTRAVRPGRRVLWGAAARMVAEHPIIGVGPDNYRLLYGRYASLPRADTRVHSNNTYIELVVGTGLVGALALLWVGHRLTGIVRRALRADDPAAIGLVAAAVAIGVHGMADSFLGFTPTYVVMAVTVGLLTLAGRPGETHADRV